MGVNVVLVGDESAGIQTLRTLAQSDHHIVAVMSSPESNPRKGTTLWQVAQQMGYLTWPAALVKDSAFATQLHNADVDLLLNVHSLFIINSDVVAAPRLGSYNLHPGPLPEYAGLNTVSWAIFRGETAYGVTLHRMTAGIDTGQIVYQTFFPIEETDTALTVYAKCVKEGIILIKRFLATVSQGAEAIPLVPQDLSKRQYFGKQVPHGGRLLWSQSAWTIVNFVRACDYFPFSSPWGHPRTWYNNQEITIIKVARTGHRCTASPPGTVKKSDNTGVYIACADEWIVCHKVIVNGQSLKAEDVLKPGDRLEDSTELSTAFYNI